MKKGWYILNYHDISWEENLLMKGIGGTFPPDVFLDHVTQLRQHARLLSVQEALRRFEEGAIDEPVVSFWFDDGLTGVRKHAMPILEKEGIKAAMSFNSRFVLRQEMFWRYKLSYIHMLDGGRSLRDLMRERDFRIPPGDNLKNFVFENFSLEILALIDEVYKAMSSASFRQDAFRIFEDRDGVRAYQEHGWLVTNHSAAHYPVSEESYIHAFGQQYVEADEALREITGEETRFWVIPFDRKTSDRMDEVFEQLHNDKTLVYVGGKVNRIPASVRKLYRIGVPVNMNGQALMAYLRQVPYET